MIAEDASNEPQPANPFAADIPKSPWRLSPVTYYVCRFCGYRSFHPYDLFSGYCQRCRRFGDEP
jgi:hypothetical protein